MPGDFSVKKTDSVSGNSYFKKIADINAQLESLNSVFMSGKADANTEKQMKGLTIEKETVEKALDKEVKQEAPKYEAEPENKPAPTEQDSIKKAENEEIKKEAPKFTAE